jgi:hypothetical protein
MKRLLLYTFFICLPLLINGQISQQSQKTYGNITPSIQYKYFRNLAFKIKPSDLDLSFTANQKKVYGVIIDWNTANNLSTIVTYSTGTSNVLLSSGMLFIKECDNELITEHSNTIIKIAQYLLDHSKIKIHNEISYNYAEPNLVNVYFLTNNGCYMHQERYQKILKRKNEWSELFSLGNLILSEYRSQVEKK